MNSTYSNKKALALMVFPAFFALIFIISAVLCLILPDFCLKMLYISEFLASSACKILLVGITACAFLDMLSVK